MESIVTQETYLQIVIREFKRMKALADRALSQISDEQFFAVPSEGDNSIAVIVKHVGGNLLSRWTDFLTSDGNRRIDGNHTRPRWVDLSGQIDGKFGDQLKM